MIELEKIIVGGRNLRIVETGTADELLTFFGEPEIHTPAHKSYPAMLVYGDLEFRLRNQRIDVMTITFGKHITRLPARIHSGSYEMASNRSFQAIEALLNLKNVSWEKDEIMSDTDGEVYFTKHGVHLAFNNGILTKIGVVYTS